jgi:hypothetical protein
LVIGAEIIFTKARQILKAFLRPQDEANWEDKKAPA